jgi:hypothetical protein
MKLTIDHLARLFEKYADTVEIRYFNDVKVNDESHFISGDLVLPGHLKLFSERDISELEICYAPAMYELLSREFPIEFRNPYGRAALAQMDRLLENLRNANVQSKRKRYLKMVGDVYGTDSHTGRQAMLLEHDELLDYRKWNNLKRDVDRNHLFLYRNSELSVIIFVNLILGDRKIYIERFKINTDLISLIVTRCREMEHCISPDFNPTEDVVSVTDPSVLMEEYIRTNARLIIIGERLEDADKRALLQIRNYDKFVRLLVVPSLDHRNIKDFLTQVKLVYNYDRYL